MSMTLKKLKAILSHQCCLPVEEDIVVRYINSGYFVHFRRKLRGLTIVSEKNPRSIGFLKSSAAIKNEKKRHMQQNYYMIHPFSIGRAYWEFFMMGVLVLGLIVIPIDSATETGFVYLTVPKTIFDFFFLLDCILTFFVGYYEKNTKKIVLGRKKVFGRYIRGLFIFDFISSVNPSITISLLNLMGLTHEYLRYIKAIQFFKVLRIPTMIIYMDRFREWRESSMHFFKVLKLILVPVIMMLWLSFAIYFVSTHNRESWITREAESKQFLCCFSRTLAMFLLVSYGSIPSRHGLTLAVEMSTMVSGLIFNLFVMSQTLMIVNKYNSSVNKYYQMTQGLREYIDYMKLPEYMRRRILDYFDFRFQKTYFKEGEILSTISDQLRQAIVLHSCKNLLDSVDIFKDLPAQLLIRIVTCMMSEIYLPGDVIVHAGSDGDSMFFISTGTVAVFTSLGKEVCHLADGSHFGEIALVMDGEKRVASVVAVDPCELFNLCRKDFHKAIEPYPDLYHRIRKMAQERFQKTMQETMTERGDPAKREYSTVNIEERELGTPNLTTPPPRQDPSPSKIIHHYHV